MFAAPPIANLLVLRSRDCERTVRFYREIGLVFLQHRHGSGPLHYASESAGFVFEIYPLGTASPTTSVRFGFSVDDVDSLVEPVVELGGTLVSGPADSPWGRRAVVTDPDGHTVELLTPPDRDRIAASSQTSTGVVTETHSSGMAPGDIDRHDVAL